MKKVKEGEICCFLPSAWVLVQFVSMCHFCFLPGFPSQGAVVVFTSKHTSHGQLPSEQLFYGQHKTRHRNAGYLTCMRCAL